MFPRYRHSPIIDSQRKRCSVCNHPVYSSAGIHPQCAIKLADGPETQSKAQVAWKADAPVAKETVGTATAGKVPIKSSR
jgi:hypothetical protein